MFYHFLRCPNCQGTQFSIMLGTILLIYSCRSCDWSCHVVLPYSTINTIRRVLSTSKALSHED